MVKLSSDYIIRKILKSTFENEKDRNEALKKINHLCLSNKFIHKIDDLSELINISVLYLHENKISKIENFDHCSNLTHLYFQNNDIEKIENISNLRKLKKLYLGYNKITVVESLDNVPNLQELHIECQNLPPGESLYFDPRTIQALSNTLRILDISSNQIISLYDLRELKVIEDLDARNNNISELIPTCHILANWPNLTTLFIEGNPLTKFAKYTDKIIAHTEKLSNLDDKIIKEETRCFLQKFELAKSERRKAKEKHSSHYKFSSDIESLAEHLPAGIRNSISRSILQETVPTSTSLKLSLAQIPAIKELSLEKRVLARPYKKKITTQKSLTKQSETELSK